MSVVQVVGQVGVVKITTAGGLAHPVVAGLGSAAQHPAVESADVVYGGPGLSSTSTNSGDRSNTDRCNRSDVVGNDQYNGRGDTSGRGPELSQFSCRCFVSGLTG